MIEEVLRKIGLTEYETKIYIALLDLGKATSGEILQKANLNTGKIYDILGSLKNKGFISEIIESGVRKFSPANPQQIFNYLDEKKEDIQKQEQTLNKIIPDILKKINLTKDAKKYRKDHEKEAQIKYFPYISPVAIVTINDLTIIDIITENPIIITIESKEVTESFIQQFELLWKLSK